MSGAEFKAKWMDRLGLCTVGQLKLLGLMGMYDDIQTLDAPLPIVIHCPKCGAIEFIKRPKL